MGEDGTCLGSPTDPGRVPHAEQPNSFAPTLARPRMDVTAASDIATPAVRLRPPRDAIATSGCMIESAIPAIGLA